MHKRQRSAGVWVTALLLGFTAALAVLGRPAPAAAAGLTIEIRTPLTECPGSITACYSPDPSTGAAGVPVTWVNHDALLAAHRATADNNAFDTGLIEQGKSVSLVIPPGTYSYHDTNAAVKGTLTISPFPPGSPGSTGAGSGPPIAGGAGDAAVKPGQHIGQVSGPAAAKPKVVVAKTPAPAFGPGAIGQFGDRSLPPIDAAASTPDPNSLPPISAAPPSPGTKTLASAPTADNAGGGRSGAFYLVGALLFVVIAAGAGGFYGFRWWRRRGAMGPPEKLPA